ncbi:NADH-plastoquinone oxidoreductase subunit [Slackia heliotrinireducens]|uniref:4Fe-4S protein n=1 Tax=Slackia heliotrinireducens (strain ATCC 29202 / DSM 20476 / NCTC 11029 / RHS 1) TaxID=471855 RepID=C7N405_SLAHD|nr:4Fe-4S binding protein [Slackia heliotrinireducens]ACV23741.1 4Fe-4S protein [Slackia heliotrinireducens DSM 20476]VEH03349.1 NADH-plastoquinone oxidoreductase subunit [Slackia heliotrinireducens]
MSLVENMITMLSGMDEAAIEVHTERCVTVRNRHAACLRCVEACTSGAIIYEDGELQVHPKKCIGCGTCATACPTSAIEVRSITDDDLTGMLKRSIKATKGHPVFACETALAALQTAGKSPLHRHDTLLSYNPDRIAAVPCLGRIDESILVGAAAYRSFDVTLVCGSCENCIHATGGALCRKVAESARGLLQAFGSTMSVTVTDELPGHVALGKPQPASSFNTDDLGASRRDFFREGKDAAGKATIAVATDKAASVLGENAVAQLRKVDKKTGTLDQAIPTRRTRLYNYLKHVGEPVTDTVSSRVIGAAVIDTDACTSCRMCTVFCPTGALFRVDEDDTWGVAHRASACVQCRLCENLCPQHAIHVKSDVPARQFMGKQVVLYDMEKPTWEPNKPDSMYNKFHSIIGEDLEMCMF